jgi:hypothetical protein
LLHPQALGNIVFTLVDLSCTVKNVTRGLSLVAGAPKCTTKYAGGKVQVQVEDFATSLLESSIKDHPRSGGAVKLLSSS